MDEKDLIFELDESAKDLVISYDGRNMTLAELKETIGKAIDVNKQSDIEVANFLLRAYATYAPYAAPEILDMKTAISLIVWAIKLDMQEVEKYLMDSMNRLAENGNTMHTFKYKGRDYISDQAISTLYERALIAQGVPSNLAGILTRSFWDLTPEEIRGILNPADIIRPVFKDFKKSE